MKKIIAAFDGLKFSESTMQYAIHAARLTNSHLVGVFLEDITYTSYKIYDVVTNEGASERKLKEYDEKDKKVRDEAVAYFENACRIAGLNHSIHRDRNVAIQELLHESIYADLLVVDRKETLTHYEESIPTRFIRDLLTDVQCPVLIVPEKYSNVEKAVILYDGEPSSVHAVKMHSYIFAVPEHNSAEVISVRGVDDTTHTPDNRLMKEFMKRHYPEAEYITLKGLPEVEIVRYLKEQKQNSMIILGAYRRGRVSRWFRTSMADVLMKELKYPLFIAHNK
ncbi:MAG: universal stress protein [Bacteroidota bacterium]